MRALISAAILVATTLTATAAPAHNSQDGKYCVRAVPTSELVTFQPITLRCYASFDGAYQRYINNRLGSANATLVLQDPDGKVLFARPYQ